MRTDTAPQNQQSVDKLRKLIIRKFKILTPLPHWCII